MVAQEICLAGAGCSPESNYATKSQAFSVDALECAIATARYFLSAYDCRLMTDMQFRGGFAA
jgi:hypothetical protein